MLFRSEVGPSQLLPTANDRSRVTADGVRLRIDPRASLQLQGPVLQVDLLEVQADLERDAKGRWWQPGQLPPGRPTPLDLTLNLVGPAKLRLRDNRPGLPIQNLRLAGALQLRPDRQRLGLQLRLSRGDGPGQAILRAGG